MARNVFEVLGIAPTADFKMVKKAYIKKAQELHPDKFATESEAVQNKQTELFQEVGGAYEQVNSEEKLKEYYFKVQNGETPIFHAPASAFNPAANPNSVPGDGLQVPRQGLVDVFFSLPIREMPLHPGSESTVIIDSSIGNKQFNFYLKKLTPETTPKQFVENFDFNSLAQAMTNRSSIAMLQVGTTFMEAEDIVNLHSHWDYVLIVQVTVPLTRLTDNKMSEKVMQPGNLAGKNGDYFWLFDHTVFTADDIISVTPMTMTAYTNTMRMRRQTPPNELWPEKLIVVNPKNAVLAITAPDSEPVQPQALEAPSVELVSSVEHPVVHSVEHPEFNLVDMANQPEHKPISNTNNLSMLVLSGFITALGISAIAIAFVALNVLTFGTAGLVVAGIGTAAALVGIGLFARTISKQPNKIPDEALIPQDTAPAPQ